MDAGEIDLLDQENALLELEDIVHRVRTMAAVSYDLDIEEVWEFLDIWAAGGNAEATKLLAALKATVVRAGLLASRSGTAKSCDTPSRRGQFARLYFARALGNLFLEPRE